MGTHQTMIWYLVTIRHALALITRAACIYNMHTIYHVQSYANMDARNVKVWFTLVNQSKQTVCNVCWYFGGVFVFWFYCIEKWENSVWVALMGENQLGWVKKFVKLIQERNFSFHIGWRNKFWTYASIRFVRVSLECEWGPFDNAVLWLKNNRIWILQIIGFFMKWNKIMFKTWITFFYRFSKYPLEYGNTVRCQEILGKGVERKKGGKQKTNKVGEEVAVRLRSLWSCISIDEKQTRKTVHGSEPRVLWLVSPWEWLLFACSSRCEIECVFVGKTGLKIVTFWRTCAGWIGLIIKDFLMGHH